MTTSSIVGLTSQKIKEFTNLQKKCFIFKSDIPSIISQFSLEKLNLQALYSLFRLIVEKHGGKVRKITINKGTFHTILEFHKGQEKYAIRLQHHVYFSALHFILEKSIMRVLEKNMLPSVKVIFIDLSKLTAPFDYCIATAVRGELLSEIVKRNENANELFIQFGKFVAKIHRVETCDYGPFQISKLKTGKRLTGIHKRWEDYLRTQLDSHINVLVKHKTLRRQEGEEIHTILDRAFDHLTKVNPVLLHGDLANHNVFVKNKKITAIVDWEDACSGDPIYDLAYFGSGTFSHPSWFDYFLQGYTSERNLPEDFQRSYWIYYLRISLAKAVGKLHFQKKVNEYRPLDSSRIHEAFIRLKERL